ncbi:MAG: winged helix-turn-helix transcriptional regulator [Candidatus Nanohaloarchaeota archaeon QJJ-5]|nr:winged helix-turn-helix transcriptional regulator [Candidatus Nanohaloarchaeota archaeon QJJ-5]
MVWGRIRSWLGLVQDDDLEEVEQEIDQVRDHVLTGSHSLDDRVDLLERETETLRDQQKSLSADVRSHDEAIEHIVEALSHISGEIDFEDEIDGINDLENRISAIEDKLERLEHLGVFEATSTISKEASGRPDGRPSDEDGRHSDVEALAHDVQSGKKLWDGATNAQKEVIKALYDSGYPLSYREIADNLGKSVSTVKNHINNLKSSGVEFNEEIGQNNEKKYMIDDRIQAFLTMRLND